MNGRVLPFEGRAHRDVERLLPWLVNGTLDADEQRLVERHLAQCRQCRDEAAALRAWRDVLATGDGADAIADADVARDWRRLHGRLQALRCERQPWSWWTGLARGWRQSASWLRWAAAAQALALLLVALGLSLDGRAPPDPYRTLGATPVPAAGNLVIVFERDLSEAQLRRLLRASGARIVDGPNDAGAYVLAVAPERLASTRAALRAAPGVALVESLAPEATH